VLLLGAPLERLVRAAGPSAAARGSAEVLLWRAVPGARAGTEGSESPPPQLSPEVHGLSYRGWARRPLTKAALPLEREGEATMTPWAGPGVMLLVWKDPGSRAFLLTGRKEFRRLGRSRISTEFQHISEVNFQNFE